jgi:hypothetical protein
MSVLCCAALGPRLTRWRCWIRCLPVSLFTKNSFPVPLLFVDITLRISPGSLVANQF